MRHRSRIDAKSLERYCRILGIRPPASGQEVKRAYRDLVQVWHPDRFPSNRRLQHQATERLREIIEAYEVLRSGTPEIEVLETPSVPTGARVSRWLAGSVVRCWRLVWITRLGPRQLIVATTCLALFFLASIWLLAVLLVSPQDPPSPALASAVHRGGEVTQPDAPSHGRRDRDRGAPERRHRNPETAPPNGADMIIPRGRKGAGKLKVRNGTKAHVVATLAPSHAPKSAQRMVYVLAESEFTILGIAPGNYVVMLEFGRQWRAETRSFGHDRVISGPHGPFQFVEIESHEGIRADSHEIVLKPR